MIGTDFSCVTKTYYVYALIDPRNGKPFYIGKGKRQTRHRTERYAVHVHNALKGDDCQNAYKYRKILSIIDDGHAVGYAFLHETDDAKAVDALEVDAIAKYKADGVELTNITNGGTGGKTCEVHPMKGKNLPAEWREKLAAAKRGKPSNRRGKTHTDEAKQKLRDATIQHALANGGVRTTPLSDAVVWEICTTHMGGFGMRSIAKRLGLTRNIVKRCLRDCLGRGT